jgi:pyruvate dehydrogenase E1 component beta subunit
LDEEIILDSVAKTGRLLVIDYDFPFCGFASEVCAMVAERGFSSLKAPIQRMTFPECSMPASGILEKAFYPSVDKIIERIQKILA